MNKNKFFLNLPKAFESKNFVYYFILQTISYTGSWFQGTAVFWLVYKLTSSSILLGLVGFVSLFPALILAPFSGVICDKFKRKNILAFTQISFLIQGIILWFVCENHIEDAWLLIFISLIFGIVNAVDEPAREAFVPLLVKKEHLMSAVSSSSIIANMANVFGPAIAGFIIAKYGESYCFILNSIFHFPLILFLIGVKSRDQEIKEFTSPIIHLKEGVTFALKNTPIKTLLILLAIYGFWGMSFSILFPMICRDVFHREADSMGILFTVAGIGSAFGGIFLTSRNNVLKLKKIIGISALFFSLFLFLFGLSENFYLSCFFLLFIGFTTIVINVGSNTVLQSMVPDYLRGRIVGLYSTMFMGMPPLGNIAIGLIANNFGSLRAIQVGSIVCFIASVIFLNKLDGLIEESKKILSSLESL